MMTRFALVLALLAAPAGARQEPIALDSAIVGVASEPGEHVGGYLRIRNTGETADKLIALSCTCSRQVEIHSTAHPGRMETLAALEIPAGGTVEIRPGSQMHLMLEAVGPIAAGSEVELALHFERAGTLVQRFAVVADPHAAWRVAGAP